MTTFTILLKEPVFLTLPSTHSVYSPFENCTLIWEKETLVVAPISRETKTKVPALKNEVWLRDCLNRSPIQKVYLDPRIEKSALSAWADICRETGKQAYLGVPSITDSSQPQHSRFWEIKRVMDSLTAVLLLGLLSPFITLLIAWISLNSPGPAMFKQWRVGYQGRLFQAFQFRSVLTDTEIKKTQGNGWLRKLSLEGLPQLLNVVRGEMSLVGPSPRILNQATHIDQSFQDQLNVLPGIMGA